MNELQRGLVLETDAVLDRARQLWRRASDRAGGVRVELYAKVAMRMRVERREGSERPITRRTLESGLAVRTLFTSDEGAGFAAASGFTSDVATWVVERALRCGQRVGADSPDTAGTNVERQRLDLDAGEGLPDGESLLANLESRRSQLWIEAGTTVEVLCGAGGWWTVRRRNRVWGMRSTGTERLWAARGFGRMHDAAEDPELPRGALKRVTEARIRAVRLLPSATAPIVSALVAAFHSRSAPSNFLGGPAWEVDDDPAAADGLAGGIFDDSGFPSSRRRLAGAGAELHRMDGPGTFWRRSFREPPNSTASNLRVPAGDSPIGSGEVVASSSRVIPLQSDLWVIELELLPGGEDGSGTAAIGYIRTTPEHLLTHCSRRFGDPVVTAHGPIVPSLVLTGLPMTIG